MVKRTGRTDACKVFQLSEDSSKAILGKCASSAFVLDPVLTGASLVSSSDAVILHDITACQQDAALLKEPGLNTRVILFKVGSLIVFKELHVLHLLCCQQKYVVIPKSWPIFRHLQANVVYPQESILDAKVMNHMEAALRARRSFSPLAFLLTQEQNNLVITSSA